MEMDTQKLQERLKKSPSGVNCVFIKVSNTVGLKCYLYENTRDELFNKQKRMAELGFAPKVYEKFQFDNYYCYSTEVAIPLINGPTKEEVLNNDFMFDYWYKEEHRIREIYIRDVGNLISNMRKHKYTMDDPHMGNFALLNGKIVCIDFD